MAIPIGTTARQMASAARWVLTGVTVVCMLTWWRIGYDTWGAMSAGLLLVLAIWLTWRTLGRETTVPGNAFHVVLLGPAAILLYHLARTGLGLAPAHENELAGELNMSMLSQLAMLSVGVMFMQSLLADWRWLHLALYLIGAATVCGSACAVYAAPIEAGREALALLGFAGVGVWLAPRWMQVRAQPPAAEPPIAEPPSRYIRRWRVLHLCLAVAAAIVLAAGAPRQAVLAAMVAAAALIVGGLIYLLPKLPAAAMAIAAMAAVAAACIAMRWMKFDLLRFNEMSGWIGLGEAAFGRGDLGAGSDGLSLAGAIVGRAGVLWSAACLGLGLLWMFVHGRKADSAGRSRTTDWVIVTALTVAAVMAKGGLFVPSGTMALAVALGLAPAMAGAPRRDRHGIYLVGVMLALVMLLAMVRDEGMLAYVVKEFGGHDSTLHSTVGFFVAFAAAWLVGGRKVWRGLAALTVAGLAGLAGEGLQGLASSRDMEWRDWGFHSLGCLAAVAMYLLVMGCRMCESPDAKADLNDAIERYTEA